MQLLEVIMSVEHVLDTEVLFLLDIITLIVIVLIVVLIDVVSIHTLLLVDGIVLNVLQVNTPLIADLVLGVRLVIILWVQVVPVDVHDLVIMRIRIVEDIEQSLKGITILTGEDTNVVLTPVLVVLILQVPDLVASVVLPENILVLGGLLVECVQEEGTKTERANLLVLLHQLVDIFLVQDISHIFVSPLDFTSLIQADGTSTNTDVLEVDILGVVQEHAHTVQKVIINRIRAVVLAILPLLVVMYLVQDDGMLLRFLVVITILTQDKLLGTDLNVLLVRILLVVQDLVLVVQEVDILVLVGITVLYALKDIITLTQDVVDVMLCLLVDMPVELVHML